MKRGQLLRALLEKPNRLAILGFGCYFAWYQIELVSLFSPSVGLPVSPLFIACVAPWALVAMVSSQVRIKLTKSPRRITVITLAVMALATIATYLLILGYLQSMVFGYLCALLIGIALSLGLFIWTAIFGDLDRSLFLGISLFSLLLAGLIDLLIGVINVGIIGLVSIVLFGVIAVVLLVGEDSFIRPDALPESSPSKESAAKLTLKAMAPFKRFSAAYLLYAFVFGITFGVSSFIGSETLSEFFLNFAPSLIIGTLVLLATWILFEKKSFGLKSLGQIISPLLVVFYILYLVANEEILLHVVDYTFSLWWITQIFALLTIRVAIDRIQIPLRLGAFTLLWACFNTAFAAGILFGQAATFVFGGSGIVPTVITGLSVIIVVLATSLQIGARTPLDKRQQSSATPSEQDRAATQEGVETLDLICSRIAQKSRLTAREEEVLVLMAQGHTRNGIAKKLFVSDNTVRAHVKSLYHKLHIHSKQELVDIIDSYR